MPKRQYERIIRWVNRAGEMSADGKFSDAILDMDCAKAELENARSELLRYHSLNRVGKKTGTLTIAFLTALCAVLFSVTPLGVDIPFYKKSGTAVLNPHPCSETVSGVELKIPSEGFTEQLRTVNNFPLADSAGEGLEKFSRPVRTGALSFDEMMHLLEVGRKALRGEGDAPVFDIE